MRLPFPSFLVRRFLRIYPAYLCAMLVTALVFAPASVLLFGEAGWDFAAALHFVVSNLGLKIVIPDISGTLDDVPFPVWNGVAWTLAYEFCCYILAGIIAVFRTRVRVIDRPDSSWSSPQRWHSITSGGVDRTRIEIALRPLPASSPAPCSSCCATVCRTSPARATAGAVVVGSAAIGVSDIVAPLPFAYLLIFAATHLRGKQSAAGTTVVRALPLRMARGAVARARAPGTGHAAVRDRGRDSLLTLPFAGKLDLCGASRARPRQATRGPGTSISSCATIDL